ncbi:TonB-dependent receptor [Flavilitoribacter nigricans]|uniref:TonB-dependent receptor plug domain-containing protein n=1 Tax=Flavilitoribacter nigricans (strain ATCC 23147 / DSM 23189 / NBRC 102662 / NCIMB 1420 / SS-2) TaxID=1122177 RepID=A0A2D0NB25_FLAN2|nr:carboxypeptidase-like regulatory domain-containing protein [Flavilitoribacter nigricans]PHN05596.1 hypothetical protein CRP01_16540 [Flavilitoribacter nigricans DSM 23189 = NBRC 102662]
MNTGLLRWIFFATFLLLTLESKAQSTLMPYHLEVKAGQSLLDAIQQLAEDYQIDFAYAPDVLAKKVLEPTSISAPDMESLLRQLLATEAVQYHRVSADRFLLRSLQLRSSDATDQTLSVSGQILDAATGTPMVNVAIALDTMNLGTMTDEQGRFALSLPANLNGNAVWIYHIGYKTKHIPVAKFAGEPLIRLQSDPLPLNEILIVDRLPDLTTSLSDGSISLRHEGIDGLNASTLAGNDILRRVQLLAGVSADDDLSSDIRIRGSNADETLIILDGMPLYKVDHFYGVFSALNSSYLEEVKLYKNVLPIQYGGRTGGMLLMRSADEITTLSGQADLNLLSAALTMDVPLSKQIGVSFSARSSHTNLANSKFFDWVDRDVDNYFDSESLDNRPDILTTNPDFGFSDWNGKLLFRPSQTSRLAVNFFQSKDDYLNTYYNRFGNTRFNQERVVFEEDFRDQQSWQNTGTSLQYSSQLGQDWQFDLEGFYTRYQFEEKLNAALSRTSMALGTQTNSLENKQFNLVENTGARSLLTKTYDDSHKLELGGSWNQYRTEFAIASELDTLLSSERQSFDVQAFANYQWSPAPGLELSAGGRLNYYDQTGGFYLAPRLTANYRLESGFALKGAYSINYQFIRELTHENRLGQSVNLVVLSDDRRFPVGRSNNLMLGANYQIRHWLFDVEFYNKQLANVIDHSSPVPGFGNDPLRPGTRQNYTIFVGEGTVNGVDLTVGWDYPKYQGHLAYTLSKSVNRFPQIQRGAPIPARDDRRHQFKWVNNYRWGRFNFSANYIYSSGRPYYDQRIIQGDRRRDNIRWLPSYQRLDVGVDYKFNIGSMKAKMGLSVFNLTDNANVKYLQFIYSTNSEETNRITNRIIGSQTDLLDRTLNLSFGLEF